MSITQAILEKLRALPLDKQQEILDFADFLVKKVQTEHRTTQENWQTDPCIGMWKDRSDMQDSTAWMRRLRQQEWNQPNDTTSSS